MSAADFSAKVRALVATRSGGLCEGCRRAPATELHHRQYKSRGGNGDASNALALCGSGNHTGCHGKAHSKTGETAGWSIRSGFTPADMPAHVWVKHPLGYLELVWVIYGDDGSVTEISETEALKRMGRI